MKTKDLIIGLLVICVIALGVLYYQKSNEEGPCGEESRSGTYNHCCVDSTRVLDDVYPGSSSCSNSDLYGESFSYKSLGYIQRLIREAKDLDTCNDIYGYQISLEHINEMYKTIRDYNDTVTIDSNRVEGIRFYEAVSTRMMNGRLKKKADLVMLPYFASGKDVFLVDPSIREPIFKMYAHFRPCPRLCSNKRIYIHQE